MEQTSFAAHFRINQQNEGFKHNFIEIIDLMLGNLEYIR